MGALRSIPGIAAVSKYPLKWHFLIPAAIGFFAALSYHGILQYGIGDRPYLYLPVGYWTSFAAGIWTCASPVLFFKIIKPKYPTSRGSRIIAVFTGLGYGFALTHFIIDWYNRFYLYSLP